MMNRPKHHDLIYDVGMHKGEDTEFYLSKGFRVIGFEAHPQLVSFCKKKFAKFIDSRQLIIEEGAIIDSHKAYYNKKIKFYCNEDISVWGTACDSWAKRNIKRGTSICTIFVSPICFTESLKKHGIPYYMKIDIEGNDIVCIRELLNFNERPDYISLESSKTSYANIRLEIDLLYLLGYTAFQAIEQSEIPDSQIPPFPASEGYYTKHRFKLGSSGLFGKELGNKWKSKKDILKLYRYIYVGYLLAGDNGLLNKLEFKGSWRIRSMIKYMIGKITKNIVPGWYDTHARHRKAISKI